MSGPFADYLDTLERMERWPPSELMRHVAQRLEDLLRHAYANAPFYRDRLACLFDSSGIPDLTRWNDVPITTRDDVVTHAASIRIPDLAGEHGPIAEFRTSGTTGAPLTVIVNGTVSTNANANIARLVRWFGLKRSRAAASIRSYPGDEGALYPHGKVGKGWTVGDQAPHYALHVATPIAQQLEWLERTGAPYLLTYPSNAMALAEAASHQSPRRLRIEMVLGHAETVPDGARQLISEGLGARFASYYSCREIGMIGIECSTRPHYHVAVENAFVELVDERGHTVAPGERGRVVVTGLHNFAMPFIRYALGDIAIAGAEPCACGRSLPILAQIEGRTRSAFTFRDGTRMWPRGWLAREMQAFVPFRQYQIVQLDYEKIELRYVPDGSGREADLDGLIAFSRRMMHDSVEITLVPMQVLPRGSGGKFEDFISLVTPMC